MKILNLICFVLTSQNQTVAKTSVSEVNAILRQSDDDIEQAIFLYKNSKNILQFATDHCCPFICKSHCKICPILENANRMRFHEENLMSSGLKIKEHNDFKQAMKNSLTDVKHTNIDESREEKETENLKIEEKKIQEDRNDGFEYVYDTSVCE